MTPLQRRAHRVIWLLLGPALLTALIYALASRPEPLPPTAPSAEARP